MKKIRGKAYAPESKKVQAHRDDLQWLKNDFEQAKKELETVKENQIKGISLDSFIYNKFSTRLDPIFYIENVLRAHLPKSRQKLHSNQVELIRAVCNPRIRKVAGIMARQCFVKNTKILMSDLSYKNIQDIKIGDQVLTPDEKPATVISTTSGRAPLYKIIPTDEYNLPYIVTDNHRLSVSNHFSIKENITVKDYIDKYGYKSNEWRGYRHTLVNSEKPFTGFLKDYLINVDNKMEYLTQHLFHFIDICPNAEDELKQILINSLSVRMDFIFNLIKMPYVLSDDIHNEYVIDIPFFLKDLFMRIIWATGYKCKWQNDKIHMHKISSTTYSFKIEPYIIDDYYGFTIDSDDHLIMLEDNTVSHNSGKCFAPGTLIMMANGRPKKVEDIEISDLVMSPESTPIRVTALGNGIEEMYEIRPKDKDYESFTVNGSHILSLIKKGQPNEIIDITVNEYLTLPKSARDYLCGYRVPVEFPEQPLNIDPYFLGFWIGNDKHTYPEIATNNQEVINYSQEYASKHIPDEIMFNSINIRRQFLAGLIDACEPSINKQNHTLEITFSNKKVADDTLHLLHILGYKASIKQYVLKQTDEAYHIFTYGDFSTIPTKLSRNQYSANIKEDPLQFDFDVISKGKGQYFGFTLDSKDGRFLLENCTVVHNTESISSFCGYLLDNYPNMRIGVFTPRIQQAEVTIGRLSIFYQMNEERLNNKLVKCTKQKIELSNNSYVSAVSASDQSNIEGLTFDIIVLDEAQKVSNYTWSERIMPMAGACVIGSTLCPLITGEYKTIKEIVDNKLVDQIPCIDINTGKQVIGSIIDYCDMGKRETLKIVLASGRKLVGTYEHPVIIKGNKWQRLDNLKIGDYIAIARELPYFGNVYREDARLLGMQISNKFEQVNWQQFDKQTLQEFISGLFDANGYFSLKKSIAYTSIYKSLITDIQMMLQKFGINAYTYKKAINKLYYTLSIHGDDNIKLYHDNFKQLVTYKQNILDKIVTNVDIQVNDLRFEKVVSIKKNGLRHVYDLTVDNYHSFIANGIYVHNTNGKLIQIGTPKTHNHFYEAIEGREADQWKIIRKDWSQCEQLWALSATYLPDHEDPTHKRERPYSTFVLSLMPKSLKQEYFPTRPDIWTEGSMSVEDFKTQYMLQFVDGDSQFLTAEEMDKIKSGDFEWQDHSVYGEKYYAGIDFAGSSAGTSDFTHISIIRFDPLTQQKQKIYAIEMNGVSYPEQINVIDHLFGGFNPKFPCQAIFADFTGCGRPVVQTLIEERGIRQMTGITFNATDTFTHTGMNLKNAMFTYAKQEISYDRFKYPSLENYLKVVPKDQAGFWHKQIGEWTDLLTEQRSSLSINKIIHSPIGGHDDVPCADVLAIYASIVGNCANSMPKPVVARLMR